MPAPRTGRRRLPAPTDPIPEALDPDRVAAERSIPRGRSASDADPTPGVDPDLWYRHVRYARSREPDDLLELVQEYEPYALALSRRYHRRGGEAREDLDQVAREALVLALRRFDPERGLPFAAFATPTITGAIRRHFRDRGWGLRVSRRVHDLTVAARATSNHLTGILGREPSIQEVAEAMEVDLDDLLEAQEAAYARTTQPLDIGDLDDDRMVQPGAADPQVESVADLVDLRWAMADLDARCRTILRLSYFERWTQVEIGRQLGMSQMQVSRALASALHLLRTRMAVDGA
jgi:RNA polymerase sigma-B factor